MLNSNLFDSKAPFQLNFQSRVTLGTIPTGLLTLMQTTSELKTWVWEWPRLCQPSTFILSLLTQSDHTKGTPELRELITTPAACIQPDCWLNSTGSSLHGVGTFHYPGQCFSPYWANPMEPDQGWLYFLWSQEHSHDNYQSTLGWRSCLTQQGWHFLLHNSFQFVGIGIQEWLENFDNSLLVGFQENSSDSAEDSSESGEILTKEVNDDPFGNFDYLYRCLHNYLKYHLGANWDTRKGNKPHEWKLTIRLWPT